MSAVQVRFAGPGVDGNLAALVADAWMNTHPWDYWLAPSKLRPEAEQAMESLRAALEHHPRHAFCIHLFIHLTEASGDTSLLAEARPFAELLPQLVPGAPHLVHMGFHTLMHTGDYHEGDLDNEQASLQPRQIYPMHNLDTLSWACRIQGRSQCSLDAADRLERLALPLVGSGIFETGFPPSRFAAQRPLTLVAFGMHEAILAARSPLPCAADAFLCGIWHFARGAAHAGSGHLDAALRELRLLQQQHSAVAATSRPAGRPWQNFNGSSKWGVFPAEQILELAVWELRARFARAEHEQFDAWQKGAQKLSQTEELEAWEAALTTEAALSYDEPPPWFLPVGVRLGDSLLRAGKYREAAKVFNTSLQNLPHNGWALFGQLQLCQLLKSSRLNAVGCQDQQLLFTAAWRRADVRLASAADIAGPTKLTQTEINAIVGSQKLGFPGLWLLVALTVLGFMAAATWMAASASACTACIACAGYKQLADGGDARCLRKSAGAGEQGEAA
ncbi:unnamed protein product [Polarella glacialis]|uniref:Uncharacterized protein n=1 Tax=Polarella glacialis TaxID=89957 RepID=A0A813DR26_POLGL|nr:unnamed protein product [Polarella glacialis]